MWNQNFGRLSGGHEWKAAFPRTLLRSLSAMAGRAEVIVPPGIHLEEVSDRDLQETGQGGEAAEEEEEAAAAVAVAAAAALRVGKEGEEDLLQSAPGGGRRSGRHASPGHGNNVAGTLPAVCAQRSFMRQGRG